MSSNPSITTFLVQRKVALVLVIFFLVSAVLTLGLGDDAFRDRASFVGVLLLVFCIAFLPGQYFAQRSLSAAQTMLPSGPKALRVTLWFARFFIALGGVYLVGEVFIERTWHAFFSAAVMMAPGIGLYCGTLYALEKLRSASSTRVSCSAPSESQSHE